ncbi:hypothetical protein HY948_03465 [Candidatus Gottesmanbacteria bacterium]|nr:hypothetical protein [Candidatus Gottesmanbacteria bacterium]
MPVDYYPKDNSQVKLLTAFIIVVIFIAGYFFLVGQSLSPSSGGGMVSGAKVEPTDINMLTSEEKRVIIDDLLRPYPRSE